MARKNKDNKTHIQETTILNVCIVKLH